MFNEILLNEVKNKVLSKLTSSGQYNTEIFGMQFFRESEPNKINRCQYLAQKNLYMVQVNML